MQLSTEVRVAAEIIDQIRAAVGENDPDFVDLIDSETDLLERLRKMLRAGRLAEADAKATGEVIVDLRERKSRLELKAERLRRMVMFALQELGLKKLDAPDMSVSLRDGPPGVEITDASILPDRYVRIKVEPDKAAIREALKDGEEIPGACLKNGALALTVRSK
jgi:hypothetical protein